MTADAFRNAVILCTRQGEAQKHANIRTDFDASLGDIEIAVTTQKRTQLAERAERMDALKASMEDRKAGKVIPAADVLAEMRRILDGKQSR